MSHFAKIDENNIVTQVIVADIKDVKRGIFGNPNQWIQTSYNTWHGRHKDNKPLRKNYASVGFTYDKDLDAFIPPKPFESWVLNEKICDWVAPIPKPKDKNGPYIWDENSQLWIKIEITNGTDNT